MEGNTAKLEVQAAFNQTLSGPHNLTVYLLEKKITGSGVLFDQMNTYNNDPSSSFYNLGNPIVGYEHKVVLNRAITNNLGDPIGSNLLVRGGVYVANFNVDMTGLTASNVSFVAFVNKPGSSSTTHQILNAQSADLGKLKDWD